MGMTGSPRERRPASSYLAHEGDVLVPAWFVAWLDTQVRLDRLRGTARAAGPQHLEVLYALLVSASVSTPEDAASGGGRKLVASPSEVPAASEVMSASQAADRLRISPRAVRLACTERRLDATQEAGVWQITPAAVAAYRPRRAG